MKFTLTLLTFFVTFISFGQIPCGPADNYETVCESNLPFLWNGELYNSAGTYTQTITNPGDCDCVYTLYLTVLPTETSQEDISICQGDLPFVWNNENYTTSGTFIDTLQNVNGCDSIATLNLTVLYKTTQTPYLTTNRSDVSLTSILTVGDGVGTADAGRDTNAGARVQIDDACVGYGDDATSVGGHEDAHTWQDGCDSAATATACTDGAGEVVDVDSGAND
jgi:hypothetical protein